jgi:hypothetical protein
MSARRKVQALQGLSQQIPYATEQGISKAEQGILFADQGTFRVEQGSRPLAHLCKSPGRDSSPKLRQSAVTEKTDH